MWMCLADFKILIFAIPIFPPLTIHEYTGYANSLFIQKNTQFCLYWMLFTIYTQNTPNSCKLGAFVCDEYSDCSNKICENAPQKAGTYTMSM